MKYELQIDIEASRELVADLYRDVSRMREWQPNLIERKLVSGAPDAKGSKCELEVQMGKRSISMTETVVESNLPESFSVVYEAKGVFNPVDSRFEELSPDRTRWLFQSEFRCKGFIWLMTVLMPSAFKKESLKHMNSFKSFVEKEASSPSTNTG